MKHHARATLAAVVLTLIPGAVLAGTISASFRAQSYIEADSILVGAKDLGGQEALQLNPATVYTAVDNPDLRDTPCDNNARQWNLGVAQKQPAAYFGKLLAQIAVNSCRVEYTRSDVAKDGVFAVQSIRPAP